MTRPVDDPAPAPGVRHDHPMTEQTSPERNVLGGELEPCGTDPMTGFHRDGSCVVGPHDAGLHAVCAVMTDEFLAHQKAVGNDLSTPAPRVGLPRPRAR